MLQLGQLDLQATFGAAGALPENIKDQFRAIQYPHLPEPLQVALLNGGNLVVEEHKLRFALLEHEPDFLGLATSHVQPGIRLGPMTDDTRSFEMPSRCSQGRQFIE
jgi:hypothetical protein